MKISDDLIAKAKGYAKIFNRSVSEQIEHWAKMGQLVEENPDLPYYFIQQTLMSIEEVKLGKVTTYVFAKEES